MVQQQEASFDVLTRGPQFLGVVGDADRVGLDRFELTGGEDDILTPHLREFHEPEAEIAMNPERE